MTVFHVEGLLGGDALGDALEGIAAEAERVLARVDAAGVAVHRGPDPVLATSNPLASTIDAAQYRIGHGPCLHAFHHDAVVVLDVGGRDRRWAAFQVSAQDAGAATVLSVPLRLDGHPIGSLNLYSRSRHAFAPAAVREAELFARPAGLRLTQDGVAVHAMEAAEVAGLELQDRSTIERAVGVLMGTHRDRSVEHAENRLERIAAELGLDVLLVAARIVAVTAAGGRDR